MKREAVKKLYRKLQKRFHWKKEDELSSVTVIGEQVFINGKPINRADLKELIILLRINGM